MEELRVIREAIHYARQYRAFTIVVKLGETIINRAEELGIIKDILALREIGMNVLVSHVEGTLEGNPRWISRIPLAPVPPDSTIYGDKAVAMLAASLLAQKLIYITNQTGVFLGNTLIPEITPEKAQKILDLPGAVTGGMREKVEAAIMACQKGISRVHIISGAQRGSLLKEIFTCKGVGTMIYIPASYRDIHRAQVEETTDIIWLTSQAAFPKSLNSREIAENIDNFMAFVVDQEVHGCMMLKEHPQFSAVEVSYLTTSLIYENTDVSQELLHYTIKEAQSHNLQRVFLEAEKNSIKMGICPWFSELGFTKHPPNELPWYPKSKGSKKIWVKNRDK